MKEELKNHGIDGDAVLVGSVAKGTFLKNPDIDIFLLLPLDFPREKLKEVGISVGKKVLPNGFAKYAEHPYWRGIYKGFNVDIVPCYKISDPSEKISAVDRTPFHTEYVRKHLKDWQRDEVRLLKAFLKGIGAYGAEAKIQGISGYLAELLVLKYETFENVLKNVSRWRRKVYLYLESRGPRFNDPVVFIDPVDSNRNAASAVSEEKKALFIHASREYIKNPSLKFFFPGPVKPLSNDEIKKRMRDRSTHFYAIIYPLPDVIDDVLYPQIRKTMSVFKRILESFHPINTVYYVDDIEKKVFFILELEREFLPAVKKHEGPPIWHENSEKFISRWKGRALRGPYIENDRLFADIPRNERDVKDVLEKSLKGYTLGKKFEEMKYEFEIVNINTHPESVDRKILSEFLDFKFPWER